MFRFNYDAGATLFNVWLVWIIVFVLLFGFNEVSRRYKWVGFFSFVILPITLSVLWFTAMKDTTYTDWFHLAKVYSSTAGSIGFWCIRHLEFKSKKTGKQWKLSSQKWALYFPPAILAINILEAVIRDFQVGFLYQGGGILADEAMYVLGGSWNFMNGFAGILNILAITGWVGIKIRKKTKKDASKDMLWPDMLWFWILAYDLWNFAYTYNCLPGHSWYCGLALLIAPTLCAFTVGKGAWLQHRAQTLAIWCMFAQTFPRFQDEGMFSVASSYNSTIMFVISFLALFVNVLVILYMSYKVIKTKRNPYIGELYSDLAEYKMISALAE
ncbi:MAG: hypothetical protein JXR88_17815 [Clostridia bacterium]|nr:hypothetical protein [Clostridia bacterium]